MRLGGDDMARATVNRRDFLKAGTAAGATLVIGFHLPPPNRGWRPAPATSATPFKPNAWIEIHPDGAVSIWTGRSEMGQGVRTAMPMIVAEELEADWQSVRVVQADADPAYGDQVTVGSRSVRTGWEPLRRAGAAAREVLIAAAALSWNVPREECRARSGAVVHTPTNRRLAFGELTDRAASLPIPPNPPLKPPSEFRIVGTPMPRVDTPAKVTGTERSSGSTFGCRTCSTPQWHAVRCSVAACVGSIRKRPSGYPRVRRVVEISGGVAVVADNTWAAFQGKRALSVEWDEGPTARWSGSRISRAFAEAATRSGDVVCSDGDVDAALPRAARTIEAVYEVPYLAHACMEPMNCTAHLTGGRCELWAPTQNPQGAQREAARVTGLPTEAITVHVTYLGGGFGRRGRPVEYVTEAVELAQTVEVPVQVVWTREDDIQNGHFRPATYNVLQAGLDSSDTPVAWNHRLVGPGGASFMITRGADELIYPIPPFRLERQIVEPGIPIAPWRGVGPSQNAFVVESFVDELAHAVGKDSYAFRRGLLAGRPRLLGVLDLAAQRADWGSRAGWPSSRDRDLAIW